MPEYDNTNSGVLFVNDKRETEKHPNMKGTINIEGVEYWLSAWTKHGAKAGKFLSLSVTPKEQKAEPKRYGGGQDRNAPRPQVDSVDPLTDDDIPF